MSDELKCMYIHDEDRNYIVRVCMLVSESIFVVPGSIVRQCDECGRDIWYDPNQSIPVMPEEMDGEVLFCFRCAGLHALVTTDKGEEVKWIDQQGDTNSI